MGQPTVDGTPPRGRYYVEVLGRGLALLDCFIDQPGPLSLIELSRRVGLGMPTCLRLIRTLEGAGYVRQDLATKRYRLSWKIVSANFRPGSVFPSHPTALGKVPLAALDPDLVRTLARRRPFERFTPTTVTAVDELLEELREVAERGYASSNQEWEPGPLSLAAPVRASDGRVVAAATITVVRPRITVRALERDLLPSLLQTAAAISAELGYRDRPEPGRPAVVWPTPSSPVLAQV